jgi:tubulin polyglutamylase TTLL5
MASGEFNIVSVAPKSQSEDSISQKLKLLQAAEKSSWTGLDPVIVGKIGSGLQIKKDHPEYKLPQSDLPEKPPLIKFSPVNEDQLVKDSITFSTYNKGNFIQNRDLLYKVLKTDGKIVRSILEVCNFSYTDSHDWNILWLGCAPQLYLYEGLNEHQRINHFPNSFEISRKDRMGVHLTAMQVKFGKEEYGFFPDTYIIPDDYSEFHLRFYSDKSSQWIVKPCNSSQGKGIFLLESMLSLQGSESFVVSKYIQNPYLIGQLKFDLRIYVLVTCYDPLRIYIYDEGLTRFASETYNPSGKASKFSYLTNYSINKKNEKFVQNQDCQEDNVGHKWSLSALVKSLNAQGVNTDLLVSKIYDLVIKTIISVEPEVVLMVRKLALGRNNCFDLLGFDVIIDSFLKPWLLEVNLSPSLATDSPLDLLIKGNLVADTLNLVGVRYFDRKKECMNKIKARIRARQNQAKNNEKFPMRAQTAQITKKEPQNNPLKHRIAIIDTIEESQRLGNFFRIFPSEGSNIYEKYFLTPRASNRAVYSYLYLNEGIEDIPRPVSKIESELRKEKEKELEKEKEKEKVIITGDDILIEYLCRVLHAGKSLTAERLISEWKNALDKFVNHLIWQNISSALPTGMGILQRLETRILEMKERRKQSEANQKNPVTYMNQKNQVIRGFSAQQLENMLKSSSKSVAKDIMSSLFIDKSGILTEMIKLLARGSGNNPNNTSVSRHTSLNSGEFSKFSPKRT